MTANEPSSVRRGLLKVQPVAGLNLLHRWRAIS
jgi:hypothetical protein